MLLLESCLQICYDVRTLELKKTINLVIIVTTMLLSFVQLTMLLCIVYTFVTYRSDNTMDISYLTIFCFCLYSFSVIIDLILTYIRGRI